MTQNSTQNTASLSEIFSSRQGEGPHIGKRMTFVRFGHCALRCQWCDSPKSLEHVPFFRLETFPGSESFKEYPNPISSSALNEMLQNFDDEFISVTGGEPLEQASFLSSWLPTVKEKTILLETSGVLTKKLAQVLDHVHIVSMDFKLPSSTGMKAYWAEHKSFLQLAHEKQKEVYVKLVVTENTSDRDIADAIHIVTDINKRIPFIVQPVSATDTLNISITPERLNSIERICKAYLPNVHTIPQMHKVWGVL
ncbi:MAG: hypothetical protein COX62_07090 [Deltaproteobacteria bacterium CG_4_10_14_0_2_um_filter_43_8]|nr:MAG: hypothetical protein COV43_04245 [Deltaproteobacteria bacterium CG11_big_fil_rev_8_21_14_0_20_42_23]PJA19215.1 MAG: hypothetical protein COX62_07090 [Deltaproteobacteria bacterium CG_4_10_14_0_2_um_filter_43_8]PJC64481.1 MAG: hypothetical protein CO021_04060 [Deltaproteobacteria bacterium CG_4_9_14_0_2_um_filter_42_21]